MIMAAFRHLLMPPVVRVWSRRVDGFNLWVFYEFNERQLIVVTLTQNPPIPLVEL